jgi:hypothetical protein
VVEGDVARDVERREGGSDTGKKVSLPRKQINTFALFYTFAENDKVLKGPLFLIQGLCGDAK